MTRLTALALALLALSCIPLACGSDEGGSGAAATTAGDAGTHAKFDGGKGGDEPSGW